MPCRSRSPWRRGTARSPAQVMPPPRLRRPQLVVGAEMLVERGVVEARGTRRRYVSPSMSDGSRPASAIARSAAAAPISRAVRPDAFVYSASPIPPIATWPATSSSSEAKPQSAASIGAGHYLANLTRRQTPGYVPTHDHAERNRDHRHDDGPPRGRSRSAGTTSSRRSSTTRRAARTSSFRREYMFKDVPKFAVPDDPARFLLDNMDRFGVERR